MTGKRPLPEALANVRKTKHYFCFSIALFLCWHYNFDLILCPLKVKSIQMTIDTYEHYLYLCKRLDIQSTLYYNKIYHYSNTILYE